MKRIYAEDVTAEVINNTTKAYMRMWKEIDELKAENKRLEGELEDLRKYIKRFEPFKTWDEEDKLGG